MKIFFLKYSFKFFKINKFNIKSFNIYYKKTNFNKPNKFNIKFN